MGACNQKQFNQFWGYEGILNKYDRRTKIASKDFSIFPCNTIGWIKSKEEDLVDDKVSPNFFSTGFLISNNLVLTSSHNFITQKQKDGKIKYCIPISFTIQQFSKKYENGLKKREINISRAKMNLKFRQIQRQIIYLKDKFNFQKDQKTKINYIQQIFSLQSEAIRHDYALLKLQQTIERPYYFQLFPYLHGNQQLAVTGYINNYGQNFVLLTHSNFLDCIKNQGIFYDIDTAKQQGGAPVYMLEDCLKLVGIHKGSWPSKKLNFATLITEEIIDTLEVWAESMSCNILRSYANILPKQILQSVKNIPKSQQILNVQQFELNQKIVQNFNQKSSTSQNVLEEVAKTNQKSQNAQNTQKEIFQNKYQGSIEQAKEFIATAKQFQQKGSSKQALQYYNRSYHIYEVRLSKDSTECAQVISQIAYVYFNKNQLDQALKYHSQALRIYRNQKGTQSADCAKTLNNMGLIYKRQGKLNQALQSLSQSLNIKEKLKGKQSSTYIKTLKNLASVYKALDQTKKLAENKKDFNQSQKT